MGLSNGAQSLSAVRTGPCVHHARRSVSPARHALECTQPAILPPILLHPTTLLPQIMEAEQAAGLPAQLDATFGLAVREELSCPRCLKVTHQTAYVQYFYNTQVRGRAKGWACAPAMRELVCPASGCARHHGRRHHFCVVKRLHSTELLACPRHLSTPPPPTHPHTHAPSHHPQATMLQVLSQDRGSSMGVLLREAEAQHQKSCDEVRPCCLLGGRWQALPVAWLLAGAGCIGAMGSRTAGMHQRRGHRSPSC